MVRFSRQPSKQILREVGKNGILCFLSSPVYPNQIRFSKLLEMDYQFRENDNITLYCGKTAILTIKPQWSNNKIVFSANSTYSNQNCFPKTCNANSDEIEKAIINYVDQVRVNESQWAGEGIVQSAWIARYSRRFQREDPFFIFDREGVLGFDSIKERCDFIDDCEKTLAMTLNELGLQSNGWATYKDGFPSEIDFIGASSSGDSIFIIEAKQPSSNSDKLYYSPIQVASYAVAWNAALKVKGFLGTVNELIRAKKKASLIPDYCREITSNPTITPTLLLPVKHMSEEVQRRLNIVLDICNRHLPHGVSQIVVWDCESTESCQTET